MFLAAAIGAGLFLAIAALALYHLAVMRRLVDLPIPEGDTWPTLSVVVPARNEGAALEAAMRTRMATDYPSLEVILVDDRSDDDTGAIADRLAAADPRITVVHNTALPEGWLGKVHALDLGSRRATGEWILFSDGDVEVAPGTLKRVVAHCEHEGFDVLGAFPTVKPAGLFLGAIHATFLRMVFALMSVRATENPRRAWAVGVGAFTLVRRRALAQSEGFAALRLEVADDLMLARVLKRGGARCTVVNGARALAVDLYPTPGELIRGVEKNAWAVSAQLRLTQGLLASLLPPLLDLSPLALPLLAPTPALRLVGVGIAALALLASMGVLVGNGRRPWGGLVYVLGTPLFTWAMLRGTVLGWWRDGIQWRGTFYTTETLKAARRRSPGGPGAVPRGPGR